MSTSTSCLTLGLSSRVYIVQRHIVAWFRLYYHNEQMNDFYDKDFPPTILACTVCFCLRQKSWCYPARSYTEKAEQNCGLHIEDRNTLSLNEKLEKQFLNTILCV